MSNPAGHLYTTSPLERDLAIKNDGYVDEKISCYIYNTATAGTIQLYRLSAAGRHIYTTSSLERDLAVNGHWGIHWALENMPTFIFATQAPGTVALYRVSNPTNNDHIYTTSLLERDLAVNGHWGTAWANEGITGYVYDSTHDGAVPLYRVSRSGLDDSHQPTAGLAVLGLFASDPGAAFNPIPNLMSTAPPDARITALSVEAPLAFYDEFGNAPQFELRHVDSAGKTVTAILGAEPVADYNGQLVNGSWAGAFYNATIPPQEAGQPVSVTVLLQWTKP